MILGKFDIIVLSLVKDEESYQRTKQCIESYAVTADDIINKVYVVETNPDFNKEYSYDKVEIIKPNIKFNYNKFFNLALEKCEAEYVFGPNNDLIIQDGCLQRIKKEFEINPNIHSISPIDREWHRHTKMFLPSEDKLYYGYDVSLHMYGCAWAARRSVFKTIGYLDEDFYFFYQDNDYAECLRATGLRHGVLTGARVKHGSGSSNNLADDEFKYTPENMRIQGQIYHNKWDSGKPFKKFKGYEN